MKYQFTNLVDIPKLQTLTDELFAVCGLTTAILTTSGEILTESGWQRICTDFHRRHPQMLAACIECDASVPKQPDNGESFVIQHCPHGLIHVVSPILIEGHHLANVFIAQFFLQPPGEDTTLFFRQQARKYGLDETAYMEAFQQIPVIQKSQFLPAVSFLSNLSRLIANIGLARLRELESCEILKESEDRYRALYEHSPDAIFLTDPETGVIIDANPKAAELLALPREEIIGMHQTQLHPPHNEAVSKEGFDRHAQAAEQMKPARPIENTVLRSDGIKVSVEILAHTVTINGKQIVQGVFRDITERKQAEDAILLRNRQLSAVNAIVQAVSRAIDLDDILNSAFSGMRNLLDIRYGGAYLLDQETGKLTLVAEDTAGLALPELLIRPGGLLEPVLHSEEPVFIPSLQAYLNPETKTGSGVNANRWWKSVGILPLKARNKTLGILVALTHGKRTFSAEDRQILITVGQAVSTAIENSLLLKEASRAEALGELDRLRTMLLANVSHELRTPLTSIKGLASTLIQPDVQWDAETQKEFLNEIVTASDRLTGIVSDLIEATQIESGMMKLRQIPTAISTIMEQLNGQLKDIAREHHLQIDIPPDLPSICVDELRIGEVLTNLVANAAAYSDKGTPIDLEAERCEDNIRISVRDQGVGIKDEYLQKVFDRFYRLEDGITRRRGGTGLGLSICKAIVESHNGRIWAESEGPGKGSCFIFTLPIALG